MDREIEVRQFQVKSDSGKEYIMVEYARENVTGLKRYATSTGLHANQINPKTYTIVSIGEIVREA